jgi:hypothetical protein
MLLERRARCLVVVTVGLWIGVLLCGCGNKQDAAPAGYYQGPRVPKNAGAAAESGQAGAPSQTAPATRP